MIDLQEQYLCILRHILQQQIPDCEVWIFGSRVQGPSKPHSDIDLVIITEKPMPLRKLEALKDMLSASDLPMRVDVADWSRLDAGFKDIIKARYEVVQKKINPPAAPKSRPL